MMLLGRRHASAVSQQSSTSAAMQQGSPCARPFSCGTTQHGRRVPSWCHPLPASSRQACRPADWHRWPPSSTPIQAVDCHCIPVFQSCCLLCWHPGLPAVCVGLIPRAAPTPINVWLGLQVVEQLGGGSLAPGLCQRLVVEFVAQQEQHYQDTILVHTEASATSKTSQQQHSNNKCLFVSSSSASGCCLVLSQLTT